MIRSAAPGFSRRWPSRPGRSGRAGLLSLGAVFGVAILLVPPAAAQSTMPSWSQKQRAPVATASRAWSMQDPGRRKTSTMSNGPVASAASARLG